MSVDTSFCYCACLLKYESGLQVSLQCFRKGCCFVREKLDIWTFTDSAEAGSVEAVRADYDCKG